MKQSARSSTRGSAKVVAGPWDPLNAEHDDEPTFEHAPKGRGRGVKSTPARGNKTKVRSASARNQQPPHKLPIVPEGENQTRYCAALETSRLVFGIGPAGTGKTYLAIAAAVQALDGGLVDRIYLARPAVSAEEDIGYLPGDANEKLSPYMQPLYDSLLKRMDGGRLKRLMAERTISIEPIGFMRGRTLESAFVVVDECQNCTYAQLKMVLTRLGRGSTMVITGDPDQIDLEPGKSGLVEIVRRLETMENTTAVRFQAYDVVRDEMVKQMLARL